MVNLNPPTVDVALGGRQIRIDTGELLFPVIALVFCALYYWDTRGLPDQSLMYAEPLLYATAVLAVITLFWHSISITETDSTGQELSPDGIGEQVDANDAVSSATDSTEESSVEEVVDEGGDDEFFNVRSAIGLTGLALAYTTLLYVQIPFLFASIAFLAAALYLFGERRPLILIVYSVGFAAVVWGVFLSWLNLPLP